MIMPSCQKKGQSVNHVLDATATQQPNQINIWSRQLLLGNQIKRGTAMGVMAMSLLCPLLAVLMIAVVSASDEAALLAFKAQLSNGGSLSSWNSSADMQQPEARTSGGAELEWQRPRRSTLPSPWEPHVPAEARPELQLAPRGDSCEPRSPPPPGEARLVRQLLLRHVTRQPELLHQLDQYGIARQQAWRAHPS